VVVAEAYADGLTGADELRAARHACRAAGEGAAWYAAASSATIAARNAALSAQAGADRDEARAQADLLRDIVGNPFQPFSCDSAALTPIVVDLARRIYEEHSFDRLFSSLRGTLAEAGCNDHQLLQHLALPGPHVRGCWVVDWLLDKS
jgi:hypothetical protein